MQEHKISALVALKVWHIFADFIYERSKDLKCKNVVFSGDVFENQSISNLFYKHTKPNNNI
ncbi:hypothetical protein [Campylobacter pinnipediorum]|uniref:hypothetical protein n=1 Tax=Campylobacter pinnipediorum TaxID=1965231 RepID=UPI000994CB92|nr:hypothetical protein [Campylobacter pinnipediorum]